MTEMKILPAEPSEFDEIRAFYHTLIDEMTDSPYPPGWQKGVYPADAALRDALASGTLHIGRLDGRMVSAMIVNHESNEGYRQIHWPTDADDAEVTILHALGVRPVDSGRGFAKQMVRQALSMARQSGQKAVRLDVLGGNQPAERLYTGLGFRYAGTVRMFYEDTGWTDFLLYEYPLADCGHV